MTKALFSAFVLALFVAGCGGGAREAGPVPTETGQSASTRQSTPATTTTSTSGTSTRAAVSSIPLCSDRTASVAVASQEGAAGTISTVWRVTNTASTPCRSFGYPGLDFHADGGWLDVQVHRGGFQNIDVAPARVVLDPGRSLYFVSYWGDVDTDAGPCKQFDRVKVTLPDNFASARLATSGCIDPGSTRVGPVSASRPS